MAKSKSNKNWLHEHFSDNYVRRAREEGYCSRAAYKLIEIQQKDNIIKSGMVVVDLGSAPGGWSEVVVNLMGGKGRIFAVDILPMTPIAGVEFIQGDFTDNKILQVLLTQLNNLTVDLVISDMAPNISGINSVDQARAGYLAELALDFARKVLTADGFFLVKVFQGDGFDAFLRTMRRNFNEVKIRKPDSSRARSKELYLLAKEVRE